MSGSAARNPETPLLTKMLFPVPYEVPKKKAKKKAPGTRSGLCRKGTSYVTSEHAEMHSSTKDVETHSSNLAPNRIQLRRPMWLRIQASRLFRMTGVSRLYR